MTVCLGESREGVAAVVGDRRAGDVDRAEIAAAGVVVGNDDLERVIRVPLSECFGLRKVGRGFSASNQIRVGGAISQRRRHQILNKLVEGGGRGRLPSFRFAAENHNGLGAHIFLFIDAQFVNFGTVKHAGNERVIGGLARIVIPLCRVRSGSGACGKCAKGQQCQKDATHGDEQAD